MQISSSNQSSSLLSTIQQIAGIGQVKQGAKTDVADKNAEETAENQTASGSKVGTPSRGNARGSIVNLIV